MTVMAAHEPLPTKDDLLSTFLALDTPPGYRAELVEGMIHVTPPPSGDHENNFSKLVRQVIKKSRTEMDVSGCKGLELPHRGPEPNNHCIPDAVFAPESLGLFKSAGSWMGPEGVAMVVEVTSSDAEYDRVKKRLCYAEGGIPLYLLIDRKESTVVLFNDPAKGDYAGCHRYEFGKPVPLPEPFGFELDTSDFV